MSLPERGEYEIFKEYGVTLYQGLLDNERHSILNRFLNPDQRVFST